MITSSTPTNKISNKLQQDIMKIGGKTIFINPFLYWRRFDENTNRWLREPGQMTEEIIKVNRNRFYPESDWLLISEEDKKIKDGTVEMFLKTLELVSTFNPNLNAGQLLEVERKMTIAKKKAFENWVKKIFSKRERLKINEKRKFQRERFFRNWTEWFSLQTTNQAILPIFFMIFLSAFIGWSAGVSKNSCNPYFESSTKSQI